MEHTFKEWYSKLPKEVSKKALENLNQILEDELTDNMGIALLEGFAWGNSIEGGEYWLGIYQKYKDIKFK